MKRFLCILISSLIVMSGAVYAVGAEGTVYGDADNNGVLNIEDVSCALNSVLGIEKMPAESNADYMEYMDLNNDSKFNTADVAEMLQIILNSDYVPNGVPEETETTTAEETTTVTETTTETTTVVTTETTTETTTEAIDTSDGVVVDNFADLKTEIAKSNNKIYVKGTIDCTERLKLSTANANTEIYGLTNDDGTAAVLDFASYRDSLTSSGSSGTGLYVSGSYYTFKNIIVQNAGDCGIRITGSGSGYCTFENCVFRYNNNSGVSVTSYASNNSFRYVDSYRNGDVVQKNGADADGFSVKLSAGDNNTFYNCRAWENSDDGWDSYDRDRPYIGTVYYEECLAWNNGNPYVFTGEYDYENGYALDKNLLYVQAILASYPDFEEEYNAHTVSSWPQVTVKLLGTSNTYSKIHSSSWAGNPNGFKFGSAYTPSSSYRYIKNCIAFDHADTPNQTPAKGFDQNNGYASYDIVNALSFNNGQNYWMDYMTANSASGVFYSFGGEQEDAAGDLNITVPDEATQAQLESTVYAYKDMIYDYVYNDIIPGEQICNVF